MHCRDLMRRPVEQVRSDQNAASAARAMREKNVGFLPVCDQTGRLVGVVTDRDLAVRVLGEERDANATQVNQVMSTEVISCAADDDVARAEALMRQHQKSRIVVADDASRPIGVISLADIAQTDRSGAADTLASVSAREVLDTRGARR